MTEATPIVIPLLNPNEPGALLVDLCIQPGQHVSSGDHLCTLETTKSTAELTAEGEGYIVGLVYMQGQTIQAGEILCYLAASPDWSPPVPQEKSARSRADEHIDKRISKPALLLAQQHNLDMSQLPDDVFVTEKLVQGLIDQARKPILVLQTQGYAPNSIIIYGGGGHGKALIDLIRTLGIYSIVGIVDDDLPTGSSMMGVPILGDANILDQLIEQGVSLAANAVGGIGNILSRVKVFDRLSTAGFSCPSLVHPTAFIEPGAILADGVQVMPHAYIGSEAHIGFGAIINTGAIVSHDCVLGDYVNLSPGAILAGEVSVGEATLVGMGVTINLRVKVGDHVRIGNSATVKQDVPPGAIVRAGTIWPE